LLIIFHNLFIFNDVKLLYLYYSNKNKEMTRKKFKDYNQNQQMLLPPSLDDMIGENYPVRVVNEIIDSIDIRPLLRKYKGGGSSSYHPRMLLKILIYSYVNNI